SLAWRAWTTRGRRPGAEHEPGLLDGASDVRTMGATMNQGTLWRAALAFGVLAAGGSWFATITRLDTSGCPPPGIAVCDPRIVQPYLRPGAIVAVVGVVGLISIATALVRNGLRSWRLRRAGA